PAVPVKVVRHDAVGVCADGVADGAEEAGLAALFQGFHGQFAPRGLLAPAVQLAVFGPPARGKEFQAIKPREESHGRISFSRMACVTMATVTFPARRPS